MSHALVVGGTGMLRGAVIALARQWDVVSVVARTPARLAAVSASAAAPGTGLIHPIALDWHDDAELHLGLESAVELHGAISLAVCWIHSSARQGPLIVADAVANDARPCGFVHIYGSPSLANTPVQRQWRLELERRPGVLYRRVLLGSILQNGARRWLTDEEISAGVMRAIQTDAPLTHVGEPVDVET